MSLKNRLVVPGILDNVVLGDKSVEDCNCYKENTDD